MSEPPSPAAMRMTVVPGINALNAGLGRLFVVVGVFDGLHVGHLHLLRRLGEEAARLDARPTVVTFDHHPDEILTGAAPPLLCDPAERLERLAAAGVAVTVVQHFDVALRMTPYDAFIRRIAGRAPLAGFLMTPDAAFGHERRGTPKAVARVGQTMSFEVVVIPAIDVDGRPVRSAEIRSAIAAGDLDGAARLLGRPYAVVGEGSVDADGTTRLTFSMPVALPPPGDHTAMVAREDGVSGITAVVHVGADGSVSLPAVHPPFGPRVRVTFLST